jgi:hypothetical protein
MEREERNQPFLSEQHGEVPLDSFKKMFPVFCKKNEKKV